MRKVLLHFLLFFVLFQDIYSSKKLNFHAQNSVFKINSGANLLLDVAIDSVKGQIVKESGATLQGNTISFSAGSLKNANNICKLTGVFDVVNDWLELVDGQAFSSEYGKLLQKIKVRGKNNIISGAVKLENDIELQDADSEVDVNLVNAVGGDIYLNGGKLNLEGHLRLVDEKSVVGPGTVVVQGNKLSFGARELTWDYPLFFQDASDIQLGANLHLNNTLTFDGSSILCGNGNILYLGDSGQIVVQSNSTLWLKNITIRNASGNNIRCVADNSTIILHNVTWLQDSTFTLTKGALEFFEENYFKGEKTFVYQTNLTSTVNQYSSIHLQTGFTFRYDPGIIQKDLLYFVDDTSRIILDGGTLQTTVTGMQLKRGKFYVKSNSYLSSLTDTRFSEDMEDDYWVDGGITLGNDTSSDDFKCEIFGGARLEFTQGSLIYRNVNARSWQMNNEHSELIMDADTHLKLYQSLEVGNGKLKFYGPSCLGLASGVALLGERSEIGRVFRYEL